MGSGTDGNPEALDVEFFMVADLLGWLGVEDWKVALWDCVIFFCTCCEEFWRGSEDGTVGVGTGAGRVGAGPWLACLAEVEAVTRRI